MRINYVESQPVDEIMTLDSIKVFDGRAYSYYDEPGEMHLYRCHNEDDIVFVWFTSKFVDVGKGSRIRVKGKVKAVQNYRGEDQVVLTRVKMEVVNQKGTADDMWQHEKEEKEAQKRIDKEKKMKAQIDSIKSDDRIVRVKYKDYKNKYPNAETIIDSYNSEDATIEIIIRGGSEYDHN